jgi:hypothetical protein
VLWLAILTVPAAAQSDDEASYSATVKVDATADSADKARDNARVDGQRRALLAVIDQLSQNADKSKLGKLDDKTITDIVDSFEVANERMSGVRYLASLTFHFRPGAVRKVMQGAGIALGDNSKPAAEGAAKEITVKETASKETMTTLGPAPAAGEGRTVIVLPVYKDRGTAVLWEDPNRWREAWARHPVGSGQAHLSVPLGDAGDVTTIDAAAALAGKQDVLAAIAQRNGGDETVVVLATARRQGDKFAGLDVTTKRYRAGRLYDAQGQSFDAGPAEGEGEVVKRAVDAVALQIETGAKKPPRDDLPGSLKAVVPIASLADWIMIRDRLAAIPSVRKTELLMLTRREAQIEIRFVGSADQLRSVLAGADLDLVQGDPQWRLERAGRATLR